MKTAIIFLIVSCLAFAFIWFYKQGENNCEKIFKEEELRIKQESIISNVQVYRRKSANILYSANSNLEWLRANICQDCINI